MTHEYEAKLYAIINHFGKEKQKDICIEEMSELAKELLKERRGFNNEAQILYEIADVLICIEQLKRIYSITEEQLDSIINYKIDRTIARYL